MKYLRELEEEVLCEHHLLHKWKNLDVDDIGVSRYGVEAARECSCGRYEIKKVYYPYTGWNASGGSKQTPITSTTRARASAYVLGWSYGLWLLWGLMRSML